MKTNLFLSICCLSLLCFFGCSKSPKISAADYIKENKLQGIWAVDTNLKTPIFALAEDGNMYWFSSIGGQIDSLQIEEKEDSLFLYWSFFKTIKKSITYRISKIDSCSIFIDWYTEQQFAHRLYYRKYPLPNSISWKFKTVKDSSAIVFLQQLKQSHWCAYDSIEEKGKLMVLPDNKVEGCVGGKYLGCLYFYDYKVKKPNTPNIDRRTLIHREDPVYYQMYKSEGGFLFFIEQGLNINLPPVYAYFLQPKNQDTIAAFLLDIDHPSKTILFTRCHHAAIKTELYYNAETGRLWRENAARNGDIDSVFQKYRALPSPIDAHKKSEYYYEALNPLF